MKRFLIFVLVLVVLQAGNLWFLDTTVGPDFSYDSLEPAHRIGIVVVAMAFTCVAVGIAGIVALIWGD